MALSFRTRALIGTAAVLGVGAVAWKIEKNSAEERAAAARRAAKKKADAIQEAELKCLRDHYLKPGQKLADQVLDSLGYSRRFVEDTVIGLNTRTQSNVFDSALKYAEKGDTGDGVDMHDVVMRLLRQTLPECPWSNQVWPAEPGSDWEVAYRGVEELLQLAILEMRYGVYRSMANGGGAGVICPGWRHEAPVPMTGAKPNDFVELLVGTEKPNGEPIIEERVHAVIVGINGETLQLIILEEGETLPNGTRTTGPIYAQQHGYAAGTELSIPKRCVYKLIKK